MVIECISDPENRVEKINNGSFIQMEYGWWLGPVVFYVSDVNQKKYKVDDVEDNCYCMIIIWWRWLMMNNNGWKEARQQSKV